MYTALILFIMKRAQLVLLQRATDETQVAQLNDVDNFSKDIDFDSVKNTIEPVSTTTSATLKLADALHVISELKRLFSSTSDNFRNEHAHQLYRILQRFVPMHIAISRRRAIYFAARCKLFFDSAKEGVNNPLFTANAIKKLMPFSTRKSSFIVRMRSPLLSSATLSQLRYWCP